MIQEGEKKLDGKRLLLVEAKTLFKSLAGMF
jgi:hypothetical protein